MTEPPEILTTKQFSENTGGKIQPSDPRVGPLLAGATRAVRRYCGWHIGPVWAQKNVILDGSGGTRLLVPTLMLESVDSAALLIDRSSGGKWETLDTDALEWSSVGILRRSSGWPEEYRSVRLSYTHGYESVEDVAQIIQQVVANALSSPMGATREQAGQLSVSWATTAPGVSGGLSLLQRDLDVLNLYRIERA